MGNKDKRKEKEKNETLAGPAEPAQLGGPTGPAASTHTLSVSLTSTRAPPSHPSSSSRRRVRAWRTICAARASRTRFGRAAQPTEPTAPPHLLCTQNRCHPFPFLSSLPLPHRLTPPSME
jgi:hypothetical protein